MNANNLTPDPAENYVVDDNIKALKLIVDHGVLQNLEPKNHGRWNRVVCLYQTETHHCCATNHYDNSDESENGYMVIMISKIKSSVEEAERFFNEMLSETCMGEHEEAIGFIESKTNN